MAIEKTWLKFAEKNPQQNDIKQTNTQNIV